MKFSKSMTIIIIVLSTIFITGCNKTKENNNSVVIYSSSEAFRNEYILGRLKEQFPDYNITIQYISTGNCAAKLKAEGTNTECDIVLELETSYLELLKDNFASLDAYNFSNYLNELVPTHKKYAPWYRISGAVIVNQQVLEKNDLPLPASYDELLQEKYRNLISMPNPKASSTGYMFLKMLVNTMGEDEAFDYFDQLAENVIQFTSSGSGPVNALIQQEAAIGLGITYQAVNAINNDTGLRILFFEEGAPYTTGGMGIIDGKQNNKAVTDVFDYLFSTIVYEDKELFAPEQIFKEQENYIENYPKDIIYSDMTGINDNAEKERLLKKWKY